MGKPYDAIVVGARCAGSPTAMLLARKGYRVVVVDRATFPSDTVQDMEGNFSRMLELVPEFADRMSGARREVRFTGASLPNYFHKPCGPGWVLVGDAGYISTGRSRCRDAHHLCLPVDDLC